MEIFENYRRLNQGNPGMSNPANRILMFTTFMSGPRCEGWAQARLNSLGGYLDHGGDPNDLDLWVGFKQRFLEDFRDATAKEDALTKFVKLRMVGDELDDYTTSFNDLLEEAGFEADAQGTIIQYCAGLKEALHMTIMNCEWPRPETLAEWQEAARKHSAAWTEQKLFKEMHGGGSLGRITQLLGNAQGQQQQRRPQQPPCPAPRPQRDADAMDVDVTTTNRTPDPDRERLIREGRCFYCKEQGHLSRECPVKKKRNANATGTTRTRVTETSEVTTTPAPTSSKELSNAEVAKALKAMTDEERGKLAEFLSQDPSF
jgi:Zinc knuckle